MNWSTDPSTIIKASHGSAIVLGASQHTAAMSKSRTLMYVVFDVVYLAGQGAWRRIGSSSRLIHNGI